MFAVFHSKTLLKYIACGLLALFLVVGGMHWYVARQQQPPPLEVEPQQSPQPPLPEPSPQPKKYIKWVDFNVESALLKRLIQLDVETHDTDTPLRWIELLAYLAAKYGGEFSRYQTKDLNHVVEQLKAGKPMETLAAGNKLYPYYLEAYTAIFDEFVGWHYVQKEDENGQRVWEQRYGLKAFSPIAQGFSYNHFDDFGNSRSYGYNRKHLGHDLMGSVGTPVIAVESGIVEVMGWNQYGGWRLGIRSFDKKRYYYYAHLRKDHPFHRNMQQGGVVKAGDVIGFLGMTGYSRKENVNNIDTPHLHYGLQLIFDESQKDGVNQIWIDLYDITNLLRSNRSVVVKNGEAKEYDRLYDFYEASLGGQPPTLP